MIVMSFSDSDLGAFAAGWQRAKGALPVLRLCNLVALRHPLSVDTYIERTAFGAKAILVRLIGGEAYWPYGLASLRDLAQRKGIALAVVPGDGRPDPALDAYSTVPRSTLRRLAELCDAGGAVAAQAALAQLALAGGLSASPVLGDKRVPDCGLYLPGQGVVADVPEGALYSDEQRLALASGQPKDVAADDRKLAWRESQKPFAGYSVSGFDASNRFTTNRKLTAFGYAPTASHPSASQLAGDPSKAQKSFAEADVLVFSGHQYAQYQVPGLWGDDSGDVNFDARTLAGPLNNVRLIVSTSCATICRDPAAVWRKLFPNAVFLGYKKSAPLNGGTMANTFASNLPKDLLLDSGGVAAAAAAWKAAIRSNHRGEKSTQAGVLDVAANQVEYWTGSTFNGVAADAEQNQCKVKGDYSDDFPDPGTWNT